MTDPETGKRKRVFRSTKTDNKKQALEICRAWDKAARIGRDGLLTPETAWKIVASAVADVFAVANREKLASNTVEGHFNAWLAAKEIETAPATFDRYSAVVKRFLAFLGASANRDIATLRAADIARFRDREAKALSTASANLSLKILRACLHAALRQSLVTANVAGSVQRLKRTSETKRRDFTMAEIKRILDACRDDDEWRGLVLFGLYTGQRLGDLALLTWRAINLEQAELAFTTRKTGRRTVLPLARPVADYLASLPVTDNPDAPLFPKAADTARIGTLSNRFREILVHAGLVEPRKHRKTGKGRSATRETSEISFHSLRHSAVTFLKAAGVSDALAREIAGHESAAVSRTYTHLTTDDLRRALDKLPDVSLSRTSPPLGDT